VLARSCTAVKADGTQCRIKNNLSATGLCLAHDPARRDEAQAARRKGAATRHNDRRGTNIRTVLPQDIPHGGEPKTLDQVADIAAWAIRAVATGQMDARTGREVGNLCQAFTGVVKARDLSSLALSKLKAELLTEFQESAKSAR
jgi:hypothetical protein